MRQIRAGLLFLTCALGAGALGACATGPRGPDAFERSVDAMPAPANQQQKQDECAWLRAQIARQRSIAMIEGGRGLVGEEIQVVASQHVATLESRAADFNCQAAFSSVAAPAAPSAPSPIASCIAACRANTSRSSSACFDACNH